MASNQDTLLSPPSAEASAAVSDERKGDSGWAKSAGISADVSADVGADVSADVTAAVEAASNHMKR